MRKKKRDVTPVIYIVDPEPRKSSKRTSVKERKLTVGYLYAKEKKVPTLRLSGAWLLDAGFGFNQKVLVKQMPGQLTIQILEEAQS